MLIAVDAVGFALPLVDLSFCWKSCFDGAVLAVALGLFGRERRLLFRFQFIVVLHSLLLRGLGVCMRGGWFVKIDGGGFAHIGAQTLGKRSGIIGVNVGVLRRARDGDVGKAGVEESGERIGVDVHENAIFGQALGTVAGDGIKVIDR